MRFDGRIRSWNDTRGFGFITPTQGSDEVFVHISAIRARGTRPLLQQRVSFEVERAPDGKKRACRVMLLVDGAPSASTSVATRPRRQTSAVSATSWGGASLFALPVFLLTYLVLSVLWRVPHRVGIGYLVLSVVCFLLYAADKFAARAGGWRTRESTLLMLGLVGGWPGAILAQQWLRHKSVKPSFRQMFWLTVVVNVALFVAWSSPQLGAWGLLR